jgi:hypothetical protein
LSTDSHDQIPSTIPLLDTQISIIVDCRDKKPTPRV